MNEKLISLLKHAKTCAIQCRELSNDRHKLAITEHVEQLKKAINELESNLASSSSEEHDGRVSDRDELRDEMCHLRHDLGDIRVELVRAAEVLRSASNFATKHDLKELGDKIMSAIGDWVTTNGPKLDRIQAGLDVVQDLVEKLQNTSGSITPEDQALLDQIEKKIDTIASDADSVPAPPAPPA